MTTPQLYSNVVSYSHTASDDLQFRLVSNDIWLREANIHVVANGALYGDTYTQVASISAGDIVSFQKFNLADIWFKNSSAGSNTVVYVVGITMSKKEIAELLQ